MPFFVSKERLEERDREVAQATRKTCFLEGALMARGDWSSRLVDITDTYESYRRDAEDIIQRGLMWRRLEMASPWFEAEPQPPFGVVIRSTVEERTVSIDKMLAYHLHGVEYNRIVTDPHGLRFYDGDTQVVTAVDGAIKRGGRLSHRYALQLTAPYTGLDIKLSDVPHTASSIVFTKDDAGSWTHTVV